MTAIQVAEIMSLFSPARWASSNLNKDTFHHPCLKVPLFRLPFAEMNMLFFSPAGFKENWSLETLEPPAQSADLVLSLFSFFLSLLSPPPCVLSSSLPPSAPICYPSSPSPQASLSSISLSLSLSVSLYLSLSLSLCLSVSLSLSPSLCFSVSLSLSPSLCFSVSFCLPVSFLSTPLYRKKGTLILTSLLDDLLSLSLSFSLFVSLSLFSLSLSLSSFSLCIAASRPP